eukprot:gene27613-33347_t
MVWSLHEAIRYRNATFPCEAGCGSSCYKTAWEPVINITKNYTANCRYVLYSLSIGHRDSGSIHPIDNYWDSPNTTCSLFILGYHSKFVHPPHNLTTGSHFLNWTIVLVNDTLLREQFGSFRRASKLVKMSTHMFMHAKVKYAVFIDAKLQPMAPPRGIIQRFAEQHEDVILAAVRHPSSQSLHDELKAIRIAHRHFGNHSVLGVTDNYTKIEQQVRVYNASLVLLPKTLFLIDSGYQVIHVHDRVSIQLRCAWLHQVQLYGDRDQISFPYVLAHMAAKDPSLFTHHNHNPSNRNRIGTNTTTTTSSSNSSTGGSSQQQQQQQMGEFGEFVTVLGDCEHGDAAHRRACHPRVRRVLLLNHTQFFWTSKTRLAKEWLRGAHGAHH